MHHLSLTACSFHLRKRNSRGNNYIFPLNLPCDIQLSDKEGSIFHFENMFEPFYRFFTQDESFLVNDKKQQSIQCIYDSKNDIETDEFKMFCVQIKSGDYGSSSDILDGTTKKVKYRKGPTDIDVKTFYLMIIFPKDNKRVTVEKGIFLFQNIGPYGVKTITTNSLQDYFSQEFDLTLRCKTIAPELFIKKVITKDNIKQLKLVKNKKSSDLADDIHLGYGQEVRILSKLSFSEFRFSELMQKIRHMASNRDSFFEFEEIEYDNLKVVVEIGGRPRTISLHHLENLSVIEPIPDEIQAPSGNADFSKLIDHFKLVGEEYLKEMVLRIS